MRYVRARIESEARDLSYRIYVSDSLQIIEKNGGSYLTKRWAEMISTAPEDTRTPEEIAADIIKRAGLVLRDGDIEDEPV